MTKPKPLLTGAEVAKQLGVSDETVRRWADLNKLAYIELPSGQRRYRQSDVDAILQPIPVVDEAVG